MRNPDAEFDEMVRKEMCAAVAGEQPSAVCFQRIMNRVQMGRGNKKRILGTRFFRKAAVILAACLALGGTCVYAAGVFTGTISRSSAGYDYTEYRSLAEAETKAGYTMAAPEAFSNGYVFDGITLITEADTDSSFNEYNRRTGIEVTYKNADGKEVYLRTDPQAEPEDSVKVQDRRQAPGGMLYYSESWHLYLPDGDAPTEEEKARAESDPFFDINYGSTEKEIEYARQVTFFREGVEYTLMAVNTDLTEEALLSMAGEIGN